MSTGSMWEPSIDSQQPPAIGQSAEPEVKVDFGELESPAQSATPEAAPADDEDFDIVMPSAEELEKADAVPAIDPNAKDYSAVDGKITNKDIQKRIAQLTAREKIALAQAEKFQRVADAAIRAGDAMAARIKALAGDSHTTTRAAVSLAAEKNKTDMESAERALERARATDDQKAEIEAIKRITKAAQDQSIVEQLSVGDRPPDFDEVAQFANLQEQIRQMPPPIPPPPEAFLDWAEQNKWYFDPKNKQSALLANELSERIAAAGIPSDHPEHYRRLSAYLTAGGDIPAAGEQQRQQQSPPVAPPARQSVSPVAPVGNRGTAPRRTVTPTKEEIEFSRQWDIPIKSLYKSRKELGIK